MSANIFLTLAIGSSLATIYATGAFAQAPVTKPATVAELAAKLIIALVFASNLTLAADRANAQDSDGTQPQSTPRAVNSKATVAKAEEKKCDATKGDELKLLDSMKPWLKTLIANFSDTRIKIALIDRLEHRFPRSYRELLPLKAQTYERMPFGEFDISSRTNIPLVFRNLRKFDPARAGEYRSRMLERMFSEPHNEQVSEGVFSMQNKRVAAAYFTDHASQPTLQLVQDLSVNYDALALRTSLATTETAVSLDDYLAWVKSNYPKMNPPNGVLSQEPCESGCDNFVRPSDEEVAKSVKNKEMVENLTRQGYHCAMEPFHCDKPTDAAQAIFSGEVVQAIWKWGLRQVLEAPMDSFDAFSLALSLLRHSEFLKPADIAEMRLEERIKFLGPGDLGNAFLHSSHLPEAISEKLNLVQYLPSDDASSLMAEKQGRLRHQLGDCNDQAECINKVIDALEPEDLAGRLNLLSNTANDIGAPKKLLTDAIALYEERGPREVTSVAASMLVSVTSLSAAWHKVHCPSTYEYIDILRSIRDPELQAYESVQLLSDLNPTGLYGAANDEKVPAEAPVSNEPQDADEPF